MKNTKNIQKTVFVGTLAGILALFIVVSCFAVWFSLDDLLQEGNPVPYLSAAMKISEEHPFAAVDLENEIYISDWGQCPALFEYVEERYDVEYDCQMGSGYCFKSTESDEYFSVSSRTYLGRYTVWRLPKNQEQTD